MKIRTTNKEAKNYVVDGEAFKASNLQSFKYDNAYEVYSYSTKMAVFDKKLGYWFLNKRKYSVTTSRQMKPIFEAIKNQYQNVIEINGEFQHYNFDDNLNLIQNHKIEKLKENLYSQIEETQQTKRSKI